MIITVVNRSDYTDEYVQEVIRAVNRQIQEDFERYWHRSAELRLEGPIGRRPDPKKPEELRGDAILYLSSSVDQEDALGYHDLNYRGIPFGFVFSDLAEQIGERWEVTFSHEALELVMDPEANLLVRGPHPTDPSRYVYHWYEMCDAVQAQHYEIDGIPVSNFVLPLYFTETDEVGSRNDFMGQPEDSPLPSFGVAEGGYIGFFDPELQDHDQFFARRGRERFRAKNAAGWARRPNRRRVESEPEPVLRKLLGVGPDQPLPGPWFEGFAVDVRASGRQDPYDVLARACNAALGRGWSRRWLAVEPTQPRDDLDYVTYDVVPKGVRVSVAEAWERSYALRAQPGVVDVEPEFVLFRPDSAALSELPPRRRLALFGRGPLPGSRDPEWSLEQIRAKQAWSHSQGAGITIGHPDTGFLMHPEIWQGPGSGPIDVVRDRDFVAEDDDARAEPLEDDLLPSGPNHGTATASVIVSAPGRPGGRQQGAFVSGVAPQATLVPLRVGNSPVHFSMRRVRKAIEYATNEGFHVLSMSLGGPLPSRHLHEQIQRAKRRGLVLIAAAGNYIPFRPVIWPARYPEVVGVAASNADRKAWRGSSRGERIDITAPGESVWRALVDTDETGPGRFLVERSDGTSYATASVAGACALWLSLHDPDELRQRYGAELTDAFRLVLSESARTDHELEEGEFGAGILDAEKLLRQPLPSAERVARFASGDGARRAAGPRRRARAPDAAALESITALLPELDPADVRLGLESLLDTDAAGLRRRLAELGDELSLRFATDPSLCRQFDSHCRKTTRGRSAAARKWRSATFADLKGRLLRDASPRLASCLNGV